MGHHTSTNIHPHNGVMPLDVHKHYDAYNHDRTFFTLRFGVPGDGTVSVFLPSLRHLREIVATITTFCDAQETEGEGKLE